MESAVGQDNRDLAVAENQAGRESAVGRALADIREVV